MRIEARTRARSGGATGASTEAAATCGPHALGRRSAGLLVAALAMFPAFARAAALPYDDAADAKAALQHALAAAQAGQRRVLVIFGANWCEDCRVLDRALEEGRGAALVAAEFEVVKVDVGRFNRNLDIVATYGDPIQRGIPAAVVLSADDRVLYATRAGELADARRMGETGLYDFLRRMVGPSHRAP